MLTEMMRTTCLEDVATIRPVLGSIEQGTVSMISIRGINVVTPYGPRFVKWSNVISVEKRFLSLG